MTAHTHYHEASTSYALYGEEPQPTSAAAYPHPSPTGAYPMPFPSALGLETVAVPIADDGLPPYPMRRPDASRALTTPTRTPYHPTLPHPSLPAFKPLSPSSASSVIQSSTSSQHGRRKPPFVNASARPTPHHGATRPEPSSFPLLSHPTSSRHVSISSSSSISNNLNDLASQHGIPQFLPPAPRPVQPPSPEQAPADTFDPVAESSPFDVTDLCSNYLNMLQNNHPVPVPDMSAAESVPAEQQDAVRALMDALQASPEFLAPELTSSPQFLTSPMESPWDDFLQTPMLGTEGDFTPDIFTSPALFDTGDSFDGPSLFGDFDMAAYEPHLLAAAPVIKAPAQLDGLYTLSPQTPALDSLNTSPAIVDASSFPVPAEPASRKKAAAPTGTRKNVTPDSLIPLNAPIQPRKYLTPSATSRKDLPATFARKRSRSAAFDEEEAAAAAAPADGDEEEAIKAKRLQNTLAARRSRKRKLEHQRQLEDEIEHKMLVAEGWRNYALQCRAMLEQAGVAPPEIPPSLATL